MRTEDTQLNSPENGGEILKNMAKKKEKIKGGEE